MRDSTPAPRHVGNQVLRSRDDPSISLSLFLEPRGVNSTIAKKEFLLWSAATTTTLVVADWWSADRPRGSMPSTEPRLILRSVALFPRLKSWRLICVMQLPRDADRVMQRRHSTRMHFTCSRSSTASKESLSDPIDDWRSRLIVYYKYHYPLVLEGT